MPKKYIILIFLFFNIVYNVLANAAPTEPCYSTYMSLLKDKNITDDKKIFKWKNLKSKCSSRDEYDIYLADFYLKRKKRENFEIPDAILKKIINTSKDKFLVQQSELMLMGMDLEREQFRSLKKRADLAVKKYPEWYCGYVFLGISEINLNDNYLKAKQYLEKSIELEETAQGRCWQAYIEYLLKNYKKSLMLYERAMELDMIVMFAGTPTMAAAHAAMILDKWSSARLILSTLKSVNGSIENFSDYQELRKMLEQHDKEQKNIQVE